MRHISSVVLALIGCLQFGLANGVEIKSISGDQTSLDRLKQQNMWTLVFFWSTDCIACEQQKPMLSRFHENHRLSNAKVIGVASDGFLYPEKVVQMINSSITSFDNYYAFSDLFAADFKQLTGRSYIGTPTYLIYNTDGVLEHTHTGTVSLQDLEKLVGPAEVLSTPGADLLQ